MQLGFDMDFADPNTGYAVPWADPTPELLEAIRLAPWKVVDNETTELNPASVPLNFSGKDIRRGVNPKPRVRVVSVLFPTESGIHVKGFDLDLLKPEEKETVCTAAMTGAVFAHNAGFDVGWCFEHTTQRPTLVLDSMLLARALYPEQPLKMAELANDEEADEVLRNAAIASFMGKKSGWALDDLALTILHKILDKSLQGPKNWAEPFLTQANYDYATGDTVALYEIMCKLFKAPYGCNLLEVYQNALNNHPSSYTRAAMRLQEPQVLDVAMMRQTGMPWDLESAQEYVKSQAVKVAQFAKEMIELEPDLAPFEKDIADVDAGVSAPLKEAIGAAFRKRGLVLKTTAKTGAPMVGEKDLRGVLAAQTEESKPLFAAWVALSRAKKAGSMAVDFSGYAERSKDKRIHSNIGHGPVTGRLKASDPNVQQAPRDQGFRNPVKAPDGFKMVASDYSALDMRVGEALAIRAQRQIHEVVAGTRQVADDVRFFINRIYKMAFPLSKYQELEKKQEKELQEWNDKREDMLDNASQAGRKAYWEKRRKLARAALVSRFARCLKECRDRAILAGTPEWGSMRDAFAIPGMDIHTWTALGMNGEDPSSIFAGKPNDEVVDLLKKHKKRLGSKRQSGKVANLSLTYAMKAFGFQTSAAKIHDIHWTLEEAGDIRVKWLASYPEMDLWQCWTELNPYGSVYIPDPEKGGEFKNKTVFSSVTLGGRLIYAFGLNAALAFEDQSTGADILGTGMNVFRTQYPEIFAELINQIHDECVFCVPDHLVEEHTNTITRVMVEAADEFLGEYGVRAEVSPAIGQVWLKD